MAKANERKRRESRPRSWVRITSRFLTDLVYGIETDRVTALKLVRLLQEIQRDPFTGNGNPERLKYSFRGCWSRRLIGEHRIVYEVSDEHVDVLAARYHYEN